MSSFLFVSIVVGLIVLGLIGTKGTAWFGYKMRYLKRLIWNGLGRCHKCHKRLAYTPSGRGICLNGDCR